MTFDFKFVEKNSPVKILPELFRILYDNMSLITHTGGSFEEDFAVWRKYIVPAIGEEQRQIVLMRCDRDLAGYFQYSASDEVFMMEEIQIKPEYQGTGTFRALYLWLEDKLPKDIVYVEAYSNKGNLKSQRILEHLGLKPAGENKSGSSYRYRGRCSELWGSFRGDESGVHS